VTFEVSQDHGVLVVRDFLWLVEDLEDPFARRQRLLQHGGAFGQLSHRPEEVLHQLEERHQGAEGKGALSDPAAAVPEDGGGSHGVEQDDSRFEGGEVHRSFESRGAEAEVAFVEALEVAFLAVE
jgi:hypothetical protein